VPIVHQRPSKLTVIWEMSDKCLLVADTAACCDGRSRSSGGTHDVRIRTRHYNGLRWSDNLGMSLFLSLTVTRTPSSAPVMVTPFPSSVFALA
jgi:hypothetical protein